MISVISCILLRHNHRGEEAGQEPGCTTSQVALQIKSSITSKDEDHGSPRFVTTEADTSISTHILGMQVW